jgi:four helix bundle protein
MQKDCGAKTFDLEERTHPFAKAARQFLKKLPRTIVTIENGKQLIKSSGSIGANYIETKEALSTKDLQPRIKIARKESKEGIHWLRLLGMGSSEELESARCRLQAESGEWVKIASAILLKSE